MKKKLQVSNQVQTFLVQIQMDRAHMKYGTHEIRHFHVKISYSKKKFEDDHPSSIIVLVHASLVYTALVQFGELGANTTEKSIFLQVHLSQLLAMK